MIFCLAGKHFVMGEIPRDWRLIPAKVKNGEWVYDCSSEMHISACPDHRIKGEPKYYTLVLSKSHRDAFDWVGGRYSNGSAMKFILCSCLEPWVDWDQDGEIVFNVPEHKAWEISLLAEQENFNFPCFSRDLHSRMFEFCYNIV